MAQWRLKKFVITELTGHIFPPLDQQLFNHQVITSPWTFQSSFHRFFRVAQTNTNAELFWRKAMVLPLNNWTLARKLQVFHEDVTTEMRDSKTYQQIQQIYVRLISKYHFFCWSSLLLIQRLQAIYPWQQTLTPEFTSTSPSSLSSSSSSLPSDICLWRKSIVSQLNTIAQVAQYWIIQWLNCIYVSLTQTHNSIQDLLTWQKYILYCQSIKTS